MSLNRYTGSDRLFDNSKRLVSSLNIYNEDLKINLSQSYEFTDNSNFHKDIGNEDNLADFLGSLKYKRNSNIFDYNLRYDHSKNI